MTDELITNDKQAMNALKQHGGNIVWVIVLVLAGYFGWDYYQKNYAKIDHGASDAYALLEFDKPDSAQKIDAFVAAHPTGFYAYQALMQKGAYLAQKDDYQGAATAFANAETIAPDDGAKAVAILRQGYSYLGVNDFAKAKQAAERVQVQEFMSARHELLGDILLVQQDEKGAAEAYLAAQKLEARPLLAVKLARVGVAQSTP